MSRREQEEKLERLAHQALRAVPPRSAPASLEARVLREIGRRAARPRWRSGITHWPVAARALLGVLCGLCLPLLWALGSRVGPRLAGLLTGAGVAHQVSAVLITGDSLLSLVELAAGLLRRIPKEWLFAGLILTGAVYAALAAIGYLLVSLTLPHSRSPSV